jgi:hypothetical protein
MKLPECVLVMVRSGEALTVVVSVAELFVVFSSLPPLTVTRFGMDAGASAAIATVRVIGG